MASVAIIGANGQLGQDLVSALAEKSHRVISLTHDNFDIINADQVHDILSAEKPHCVINTAAMHNVEACENDPERSFLVNGVGSRNVAKTCNTLNAYLVHVSTDYVFDGAKKQPYVETDAPSPLNVYGNTKLSGEYFVRSEAPHSAVLRVSGVYGCHPCRAKGGRNFVRTMIQLSADREEVRVVDDEILTPTFTEDIAAQTALLLEQRPTGLFHATAQGACSWYQFAERIFKRLGREHKLRKTTASEFPAKVRRPLYSVLDNAHLRALHLDIMPQWQDGLDRYLSKIL